MAIQSSGPISLSDLATEFGGTIPHSISEYYREGGLVPANNTAVSTSGAIGLQMFYSAVNEIQVVAGATATLDISTLFTSAIWTSAVPKRVTIAAGTLIGTTTIPATMGGTLEIDNAGDVIGLGGAIGADGGDAIINNTTGVTINNTGLIAGGGGGGGAGGTGGNGSYESVGSFIGGAYPNLWGAKNNRLEFYWGGSRVVNQPVSNGISYTAYGIYRRGPFVTTGALGNHYQIAQASTVNTTGGSGGVGGVGQGYNQSNSSGSAGASGGTNAGAGGTGGSGGTYGIAGGAGGTGANGNVTNGSAGTAGGAAGAAVSGTTITMNNTGTVNGTVV